MHGIQALSQIEEERQEMHKLASLHGLAAQQVLEQSQRLDSLLNAYQTLARLQNGDGDEFAPGIDKAIKQ